VSAAVVVTGAGAVAPLGSGRAAFVRALAAHAEGTPPVTTVRGFDASALPQAKSLRRAAAHVLYGVAAAAEALREAREARGPGAGGGAAGDVAAEESGLVFASALGSAGFSYRLWRELLKSGPLGASPVLFSEGVPNALAGHVARALELLGPGHMLGGGSDAGLRSLALARDLLEGGRAQRVIVGAAEELSEIAERGYARLGLAAGEPHGRRRRGVTRGRALRIAEGAAALVLERDEARSPRRALAEVLSLESCQLSRRDRGCDAAELAELIRAGVTAAGLQPSEVGRFESAANGTHVDAIEQAALARLAHEGFAPEVSRRVRAACGDAFTATPLLQAIEALPFLGADGGADGGAAGRRAAVLSISPFGAATLLVLGPPTARSGAPPPP
jgi:3-oxoacyl-[acyl-carrier-protein] synthase II